MTAPDYFVRAMREATAIDGLNAFRRNTDKRYLIVVNADDAPTIKAALARLDLEHPAHGFGYLEDSSGFVDAGTALIVDLDEVDR